jgi:hypothetical protein
MKKLLFILMMATVTMSSTCSKEDDLSGSNGNSINISTSQVPAAVMSAFNSRYPTASGQIEWEREDGNTYKVKFFIGGQRWQAIFASTGAFLSEKAI